MPTPSVLAQFNVTLSVAVSEPVSVDWYTVDGTAKAGVDYAGNKGTVVFAPGQVSKLVDILVFGRAIGAEDRSFFVEMLPPTNAILGASVGECIIHVDTTGSTPVTQIIVPTGPKGDTGDSAYQTWLSLPGNEGKTEQQFIDSLKPSAEEIAEEVAPLLDVGDTTLTAEGTEGLSKPDNTTVKALARRAAYARAARIATVTLANGDNSISQADMAGDVINFASASLYPRIFRGSTAITPQWDIQPDGRILVKGANAGDILYLCQYDFVSDEKINTNARILLGRALSEAGLNLVSGSFYQGATVTSKTDAVFHVGSGQSYTWAGALPKTVPAGSTPASTGGVSPGNWESTSGQTLRGQLSAVDGALKFPAVQLASWRARGDTRGWGGGEAGFRAAMTEISAAGGGYLEVNENILFTSIPIEHKKNVRVQWNAVATVKSGLSGDYAYVMDGGADTPSYNNEDHFNLANRTTCHNLFLLAENYKVGIAAAGVKVQHCYGWTYKGGAIIGFNKGGLYETNNYEGKASDFTAVVADVRLVDSVGFESNSTDSWFNNISPVGYSIGGRMNKSGNSLTNFHPWGNTATKQVGVMGDMNIGLIITENAGFSKYANLILDTPVRKNKNNQPSRTNGGVGLINDAWDATFDNVLILPSKTDTVPSPKMTLPVIFTGQRCSVRDLHVSGAQFATDAWVSFEGPSGIAQNEFSGYGYALAMRGNSNPISASSGASLAPATGVTISTQTLSSGIYMDTMTFSVSAAIVALPTATSDVTLNISSMYGVKAGAAGTIRGGLFAFSFAATNNGKQLISCSLDVTADNTAKFYLTFADGTGRYAKWSDVPNSQSVSIALSGIINVR